MPIPLLGHSSVVFFGLVLTLSAVGPTATLAGPPVAPASHGIDVQTCDWSTAFSVPGPNGRVTASVVFDDGTGPALYVGGHFTTVDRSAISGIARWDGTTWSAVGAGFRGEIFALTVFDDGSGPALYAAGNMIYAGDSTIGRIAKWDGSTWSGLGVDDAGFFGIYALAVFDDGNGPKLAVGGTFDSLGGVAAPSIAAWNGTTWEAIGAGTNPFGAVFSFATQGGVLYAAGSFSTIDGEAISDLAAWDGTRWSAVGDASLRFIDLYSLAIYDDGGGPDLYAASFQSFIGGVATDNRVLRWDGSTWEAIGEDFGEEYPVGLAVHDDGTGPVLFVSAYYDYFAADGRRIVKRLASWDGTTWTDEATGLATGVYTMATFDDGSGPRLIVGGAHAEGAEVASVMQRRGDGSWSPLTDEPRGLGMRQTVEAFTRFDDGSGPALYAAGSFRGAGRQPIYGVARWNGVGWEAVGAGLDDGVVKDLVVYDDGSGPALYAGGLFTIGTTGPQHKLARWDGLTWSPIAGTSGTIEALAVFDGGGGELLIVAGDRNPAGDPADRIGSWNGTTWTPLGVGFDGRIVDLAVFDGGSGTALYAIGDFTSAGAGPARHVARWDGTDWSAVGAGLTDAAHVATVYDDGTGARLVVGGTTGSIGTLTAWNGTAWSPVFFPAGSQSVTALDTLDLGDGPSLVVGGRRSDVSTYLARETSTGWLTLDLDGRGSVRAFAELEDLELTGLLVGSSSTVTGSTVSSRLALTGPCASSVTFADDFETGSLDAWLVVQ